MIRPLVCSLLLLGFVSPLVAQDEAPITQHRRWVTSLAFSNDGKQLYTTGGESLPFRPGDVKIWEVDSGKLAASLEGAPSSVWSIAVTSDNATAITSGYDGKVLVWNLAEKKPRATLDKHKAWVRSVALSPDNANFATGGEDGTIVIWTTADAKQVKEFKAHDAAVYDMAFSPDGNRLATASTDKTAKLWDWKAEKPAEVAKFAGHATKVEGAPMPTPEAVWSVAFNPAGNQVASSGADGKIRIWDDKGAEQAVLEGHKDWVGAVAWSKENVIASASHDKTIRLWNPADKKELHSFPAKSTCWGVAFSADGKLLAAGSHKEGVRIFDVASKAEKFPAKAEPAKPEEKKPEEKK